MLEINFHKARENPNQPQMKAMIDDYPSLMTQKKPYFVVVVVCPVDAVGLASVLLVAGPWQIRSQPTTWDARNAVASFMPLSNLRHICHNVLARTAARRAERANCTVNFMKIKSKVQLP